MKNGVVSLIEVGKTYTTTPYEVGGNVFSFTPNRPADIVYDRKEEYGWAEGGVLSIGFYCNKLEETVYLWLNKEKNLCIELVDRKDYDVQIGFFGNGWKLKRYYVNGPRKYTIKPEYPDFDNPLYVSMCMFANHDSILHKSTLPKEAKCKIMEFMKMKTESDVEVYEV